MIKRALFAAGVGAEEEGVAEAGDRGEEKLEEVLTRVHLRKSSSKGAQFKSEALTLKELGIQQGASSKKKKMCRKNEVKQRIHKTEGFHRALIEP